MNFVVNYEVSRCFSPGGGGGGFFTSGRSSANFGGSYGTGGEGGKRFLQGGEGGRAMSNDALGSFCGGRGVYRNGGGGGYSWGASGITSKTPVGVGVAHTLVISKVTIAVLTTRDISLCLSRGLAEEAFQHVSSQGSCPSEFFQLYSERTHLKSNKTLFERVFLFKGYFVKISRLTRINDCT